MSVVPADAVAVGSGPDTEDGLSTAGAGDAAAATLAVAAPTVQGVAAVTDAPAANDTLGGPRTPLHGPRTPLQLDAGEAALRGPTLVRDGAEPDTSAAALSVSDPGADVADAVEVEGAKGGPRKRPVLRTNPSLLPPDPTRWRVLAIMSFAILFGMSTWFSANAVAPSLRTEPGMEYTADDVAALLTAVNYGFFGGTVLVAASDVQDVYNSRHVFAFFCTGAAICNSVLAIGTPSLAVATVFTAIKGLCLAALYPAALKVVAGWFSRGRGLAMGIAVGAVTVGSGLAHIVASFLQEAWRETLWVSSGLTLLAAVMAVVLVTDGPWEEPSNEKFDFKVLLHGMKDLPYMLNFIGYAGHQWELYAMWAATAPFFKDVVGEEKLFGDTVALYSLLAFCVFVTGAFGATIGGIVAERIGRTYTTSMFLAMSGGLACVIGWLPRETGSEKMLVTALVLVWGIVVIADSAQFQCAVTELVDPTERGSLMTAHSGVGFLFTIPPVRLTPVIAEDHGWGPAFMFLAVGPVIGIIAMLWLRQLPAAKKMAHGKR